MNEKPIISIIIPSRNRQKYAANCIQSILNIDDTRIELVVHDNSDTNELEIFINENINDERLIYRYDSSPMSTVHNFNKSMEFVNGEYICFIGDDDGINPEIIEAACWAKKNDVDAVVAKARIGYLWPNENRIGKQFIYPFTGKIETVDTNNELNQFLNDGGVYYLNYNLPKVYHGLVRRASFQQIKEKLGYYFGGLSVDIFASISFSLIARKVVAIDYPLTIAGSSAASEQTHRTEEAKKLELKNAPHFRARGKYTWDDTVPAVYSGTTIWAESSIQALNAFGRTDLIKTIDKYRLAAHISLDSPQHEQAILNDYLRKEYSHFVKQKLIFTKWTIQVKTIQQKLQNRVRKLFRGKSTKTYKDVDTINDAVNICNKYLADNNISLDNYLSK